ncbi:MAG TPA: hypothetical protein DD979_17815 [Gammaproteobacteria bacterium]|jgi:hypothetical protein|nr:hypothetical protein [Gammaproteobacteria bacterium]
MVKSKYEGTPEQYFAVPLNAPKGNHVDVLYRLLKRVNAVTLMLEAESGRDSDGFTLRHDVVVAALDTVTGLTNQALQLVEQAFIRQAPPQD